MVSLRGLQPVARVRAAVRRQVRSTTPPAGATDLSLTEIGLAYDVAKARPRTWSGKALTDHYEPYLAPFREQQVRILELGVKEGRSLRMWKAYFPQATIVGVDHHDCEHAEERRVRVIRGDQADPVTIERAVEAAGGPLHVICDDGSHYAEGQIGALTLLWPHLAADGVYLIDDIHTSYRESYAMGWRQPGTTVEYLKQALDDVHVREHGQPEALPGLAELHVYFHLCVLRKLGSR